VAPAPVTLVTGDDQVLVAEAVTTLVDELVGDEDRSLLVSELTIEKGDGVDPDVGPVVDAASTLPFLTDRRVVVARGLSWCDTAALKPLLAHLEAPLETTSLVLVWDKQHGQARAATVPKGLKDAVVAAGGVVQDTKPGTGKARAGWIDDHLDAAEVDLDRGARALLVERLGEDVSRLGGVLSTLTATFGPGASLSANEVEPYLGEAGSVPPWDLTDAIDKGDRALAIAQLHRMMEAGDRHALQVMGILTNHYGRLLRLDGADVRDEKDAAAVLGMKGSTFPARKALAQARAMGTERVAKAIGHLGEADLDLRGRRAWPDELVLEVLVARLAMLSRR
jgi:DNA polymerase III subunit delta